MSRPLSPRFYRRPPLDVARGLIGKRLVLVQRGRRLSARITETEAYVGTEDPASHAYGGRRGANESMYAAGGTIYVYFTYGHHFMLNVAVGRPDWPCAVLLRAAVAEEGVALMWRQRPAVDDPDLLLRGPGNLCRAFGIDKRLDGRELFGPEAWIENTRLSGVVKSSGRIGIGDRWPDVPWRFYLAGHRSVSGPRQMAR